MFRNSLCNSKIMNLFCFPSLFSFRSFLFLLLLMFRFRGHFKFYQRYIGTWFGRRKVQVM